MGKEKKKRRRESFVEELTRYGKSTEKEEKELMKLKQEGVLFVVNNIRIGMAGLSYTITSDLDKYRHIKIGLSQIPKRMRPFSCSKKVRPRRFLGPLHIPNPREWPQGLEFLNNYYQQLREGLLSWESSRQEWRQLQRAKSRFMKEESRKAFVKDQTVKDTVKESGNRPIVDLSWLHSNNEDSTK